MNTLVVYILIFDWNFIMQAELPYRIICTSTDIQNRLISIFSEWSESLNLLLKKHKLELLDVKIYENKLLDEEATFDSQLMSEVFSDETELDEFLRQPIILNGISVTIPDARAFVDNTLSLVFLKCSNKKANGICIRVNLPIEENEQGYKEDDEFDRLFSLNNLSEQTKMLRQNIVLSSPFFMVRYNSKWYQNLLGVIASISPNIFLNTGMDEFLEIINGDRLEIESPNDYQSELSKLAEDYLDVTKNW